METPEVVSIQQIQAMGVNAADIKKLTDSGIHTVGQLLQTPVRKLLQIKGLSEAKVDKIRDVSKKLGGEKGSFRSAVDVLRADEARIRITTGSKELDGVLGGGIETGSITEVYGEFRTGKTQLCHTLSVTCQLDGEQGGGMGRVIVVDTEGSFRPERVAKIAESRFGLDPTAVLDNIRIARVYNVDDQMDANIAIAAMLADEEEPTRLIIVDSVMNLFRTDYCGRGELAERQQRLNQYLGTLKKIAEEFSVAVVLINQVTANPDSTFAGADAKKPIGGHVLAHASTTRIYLRKGKGEQRIAKIADSPTMPEADAIFALADGGVVDID